MSEQTVQVQDATTPTKNMRTIQQTAGGNTVQSEVVILATGAANAADTYDARQIRTLTSVDVVTAILQGVTLGQKPMTGSLPVVIASNQTAVSVSGTVTANEGGAPWTVTGTRAEGAAPVASAHQTILSSKDFNTGSMQFLPVSTTQGLANLGVNVYLDATQPAIPVVLSHNNAVQFSIQNESASIAAVGQTAQGSIGGAATLQRASAQVTGTWSGQLVLDVTFDNGTSWTSVQLNSILNYETGQWQSSIVASGEYSFSLPGCNGYRLRAAYWNSGSALCNMMNSNSWDDFPVYAGTTGLRTPYRAAFVAASDPSGLLQPMQLDYSGKLQIAQPLSQIIKNSWGPGWGDLRGW